MDEYTNSADDERYNMFNNLIESDRIVDEVIGVYRGELPDDPTNQISILPVAGISSIEEDGYMDSGDIDEDGEMGDELH